MDPTKSELNDLNDMGDIFDIDISDFITRYDIDKTLSADDSICPKCGSASLINDYGQGHIVCSVCGLIGDDILDANPEWKTYDDSSGTVGRCGKIMNQLLPKSSTGTRVEAYGRIAMIHAWNSMPYKERALNIVFKKLDALCKTNNIPKKIYDDSCIMYKIVSERKHKSGKNKEKYIITRGINRNSIIAASLFYACRRNNIPRSPKEIAAMFKLNETDLNKGAKNFLKLIKMNFYDKDMGTSKPIDFVRRKCDDLNIKSIYTAQAISIANNIDKLDIASTHTSCSLAAASILLMAEVNKLTTISKPKLSQVFGLSEVTICKTYKKVREFKNILTSDKKVNDILEKINNDNNKHIISKELYDRMKKFNIDTSTYQIDDPSIKNTVKYEYEYDDEYGDEYDLKRDDTYHMNIINNYLANIKKATIKQPDYIDTICEIEDEFALNDADYDDIFNIYKNIFWG
jgi:transcription initiation factor TFIIB